MGTINKINVGGTEYDIVDSTALHSGDNALMIKYGETITDAKWHEIVFAYQEGKPIFCYATADAYSPSDSQEGIFYNLPLALLICNDYNTAETYGNQMHFGAVYEQVQYNNSDIQLNLVTSYWSGWDDGTFTIGWSNETQQITPLDVGKVDQQKLSTNATYPLLIATTNTIPQYGGHRGETGITSTLYANPSTGSIYATKVDGLTAPTTDTEAANKKYVDDAVSGSNRVFYGYCNTASATAAKVITCPEFTSSDLGQGTILIVTFNNPYGNTAATSDVTFNVNGTGAIPVKKHDERRGSTESVEDILNPSALNGTKIYTYQTGLGGSRYWILNENYSWNGKIPVSGSDTADQFQLVSDTYSSPSGDRDTLKLHSPTGATLLYAYENFSSMGGNYNQSISINVPFFAKSLAVGNTTGYTTIVPSSTNGYQQGRVMFVLIE